MGVWIKAIAKKLTSNEIRIAHLEILIKDYRSSVKISLTGMDEITEKMESQLVQLSQLKGIKFEVLINLMAEGDQVAVESALDAIILQIPKNANFTVKKLSGFTRVPDKPKPTLRIGN